MDYKNIKLLKKYVSENGKILPSRVTNVSQNKESYLFQSKELETYINIK